jgi:SAM-dependent methyltransferase
MIGAVLERFASEYARHRAAEGRGYNGRELLDLPYLGSGPLADQWSVRSRTFEKFMALILEPTEKRLRRTLAVADLGAGNGWLSHRIAAKGHKAFAIDIRNDSVDGLGAAGPFLGRFPDLIECLVASFDAVPLRAASIDIAIFNASIHYATDLRAVLAEAGRVTRPGGRIVILDSPFYRREADGLAMVAEKKRRADELFGASAAALMALPFIEFLTHERLAREAPELSWRRHRVRYPLSYEWRPIRAALLGKRAPSRFDLWVAERP